jgi:hypothetical protein
MSTDMTMVASEMGLWSVGSPSLIEHEINFNGYCYGERAAVPDQATGQRVAVMMCRPTVDLYLSATLLGAPLWSVARAADIAVESDTSGLHGGGSTPMW